DEAGVPEIVDRPEIGRLFDGSEQDLARALLEALELAEDERTPSACRKRAKNFSTEATARGYAAIYTDLIAGRAARSRL
ncbi:MAG: hypothetical protein QOF37_1374, partial [Thermoleophilaceae bacterium]|nr:hypothetical protein [Thermoleophilaceae bacterium]